jgi:hypothetical protein
VTSPALKSGACLPITRDEMRELRHKAIGLFFWFLMGLSWFVLARGHKAGIGTIADSATYVAIVVGAVLAVTLWWIRHNAGIYRRKGERKGRPTVAPRTDEDRLGRPLRWQLDGGAAAAVGATHLVIELDGAAKVYVEAR